MHIRHILMSLFEYREEQKRREIKKERKEKGEKERNND